MNKKQKILVLGGAALAIVALWPRNSQAAETDAEPKASPQPQAASPFSDALANLFGGGGTQILANVDDTPGDNNTVASEKEITQVAPPPNKEPALTGRSAPPRIRRAANLSSFASPRIALR